jgi:hypothetical protein
MSGGLDDVPYGTCLEIGHSGLRFSPARPFFSHGGGSDEVFRIGGLCVPSVCWIRGERWNLQQLDARLVHEPWMGDFSFSFS